MSWRTVVIANRCKLDLKLGYLVVRGDETTKRVFLDEIAILIIEDTAVSLTGCLISALTDKKIKVVFCDEKRNPTAEIVPHHGCHDCSAKIRAQIAWSDAIKRAVWTEIVSEKIRKQAQFLEELMLDSESQMLSSYLSQIEDYDPTNREGHAAKVYFNGVFGSGFTRSADNSVNAALNYGYGLVMSMVNREISANGYLTQLGLFHNNMYNPFNLACDLMEPFRILVDRNVRFCQKNEFDSDRKRELAALLHSYVRIDGTQQTVLNACKVYVRSVFDALNDGDVSRILNYEI